MKNIFKISTLLLFLVFIGCNSDDTSDSCQNTNITLTSLEAEYNCVNTPFSLDINLQNTFSVIRSQDAFNTLTSGECAPEIDFNTFDLIIGKQGLTNGFDTIIYAAIENCNTKAVALTVAITLNATTTAPNITYHVLVPKLTNPQATTVDIILN